jgi:hypothetical protein
MNLFARLFKSKYDDEQLVAHAQTALVDCHESFDDLG